MFALLEIAPIYKAPKLFADLQGPIWDFHEKMPTTEEFRLKPQRGVAL